MPAFGKTSEARLATCHPDLQRLFREVVKWFDCTVLEGHRSVERQQDLYASGRTKPGPILTKCDGVTVLSKHNREPSLAVDVAPYPVDWQDRDRFYFFAGFVKATALMLEIPVRWGGDWDGDTEVRDERFVDLPHWELLF